MIRGELVVLGKEPDGDSMRFRATDPAHYAGLHRGWSIRPYKDGTVQLRLEGIDAPETHYQGRAQPLSEPARDALLADVGIGGLAFTGDVVTAATPATVPAAILSKGADTNGRPISYLLVGEAAAALVDGDVVRIDDALVSRTVNYRQVETGASYPLMYSSMPTAHREVFRAAAERARDANLGVWAEDRSGFFRLETQDDVGPGGQLVFPKLFRRATDYLRAPAAGLRAWLEENGGENDVVLVGEEQVAFSALVEDREGWVRFRGDVVGLVFVEK